MPENPQIFFWFNLVNIGKLLQHKKIVKLTSGSEFLIPFYKLGRTRIFLKHEFWKEEKYEPLLEESTICIQNPRKVKGFLFLKTELS